MGNPIKVDDLGVPLFLETSIYLLLIMDISWLLFLIWVGCWLERIIYLGGGNSTPILGDMISFDEHIFQRGWNHQLVYLT